MIDLLSTNMLVPFVDFDPMVWASVLFINIAYQRYRFKTPFKVVVSPSNDGEHARVRIERRCFFAFPPEAKSKYYTSKFDDYADIKDVSKDWSEADEELVEAIVEAKSVAKRWCNADDELSQFVERGRKLLKK